ncbi:hypothetical protein JVT61DRAFT_8513 [Boletus reticuloceps]|uniref:Mid2 domain-containing protein n=1 Tax=Boletus reticuloceps TaxID=495285 RepID=A0A8I2YXA3_9AGAM|nr:hypothetical protein JVT61DRAFT_8513 [Boletus reticuloceps]
MQSSFSKRLLASLALVSFASADYYIDDQHLTSLLYSENPAGAKWRPFHEGGESLYIRFANGTMMTVDTSHCFNYTYNYATCTISDNCQVQIPFTGSGITIYVLQAGPQGINASITIDGGAPKNNVLPAPPSPHFYAPNVTLFSVQGITTGNHTATMTVQNWDNIFSGMMFDYAVINQTIVATTTSSVASSTAVSTASRATVTSTATPSPSKSTTNVGAMVGVALGALAGLIALLLVIFYLCRRRREPQRLSILDLDADIRIEPFSADSLYYQWPERRSDVTEHPTTESLMTGTVSTHAPFRSESSGLSGEIGVTHINTTQIVDSTVTSAKQAGSYKTPSGPSEISHPTLTDDQADFVNNLYTNNVPAPAIARVIERTMAGERQPSVDGFDSLHPPSYYYAQ